MSDAPLLEACNLAKRFPTPQGGLTVLQGVNLTLARGDMAALLGSSGVGKSTLLQILGTLERPSEGEVLLEGRPVFRLGEGERAALRNRRIGFVYQFHHLLPEFSALENVMMPLLIGRQPAARARARAEAVLAEVGLGERLHHPPGKLSGGEQQRVAIARAVVGDPDLLLADEPTGNLDQATADEIFRLFLTLNRRRGLTCLLVTHNPQLAAAMDRRLHLERGGLREEGRGEAESTGEGAGAAVTS